MTGEPGRYDVIGVGGVGSWLVRLLAPFLSYAEPGATIFLVDGDRFEEANRSRMAFRSPGLKAVVLAEELAELYGDRIHLVPVPRFIHTRNARDLIAEGDVVFAQPDNHATRRVVERRCMRLANVAFFSGGNDDAADESGGTFGNVQAYIRKDGRHVTNPISTFHPEIAQPEDQVPNARGCAFEAASNPQILFTNAAVATAMLSTFYAWRVGRLDYEEVYLDILAASMTSVRRDLARARGRPRPVAVVR